MAQHSHNWIDRSAMSLSGLCLVHCLAGAVLLSALSISGGLLSHQVHAWGLGLALPLAAFGLWRGVARHGRMAVALLGAAGLALMAASLLVAHGTIAEIAASVIGVLMLGTAHWLNLRWSRG
jgi:hypothetical protein